MKCEIDDIQIQVIPTSVSFLSAQQSWTDDTLHVKGKLWYFASPYTKKRGMIFGGTLWIVEETHRTFRTFDLIHLRRKLSKLAALGEI